MEISDTSKISSDSNMTMISFGPTTPLSVQGESIICKEITTGSLRTVEFDSAFT